MNLIFRLLRILVWGLVGPRLDPLGRSIVSFRVWPNDLDINIHMNNGRYLTIMDIVRKRIDQRVERLIFVVKLLLEYASDFLEQSSAVAPFLANTEPN